MSLSLHKTFVNLHFRQGVDADTTYRLIQDELSLGESTMSVHGISGGNISVDGSPILNLASFVQTYMPPMADKLVKENISKNLVGASTFNFGMVSYNSTHLTIRCRRIPGDSWGSYWIVVQLTDQRTVDQELLHTRCELIWILIPQSNLESLPGVSMIADLWHAPSAQQAVGTATTGSSEAVQLGGLAMKKLWQQKRKAAGKSIHAPG